MTLDDFVEELSSARDRFRWVLVPDVGRGSERRAESRLQLRGTTLAGPARYEVLDPLGALCYLRTRKVYGPEAWPSAAEDLELSSEDAERIVAAVNDRTWRGEPGHREPDENLDALRARLVGAVGLRVADPAQRLDVPHEDSWHAPKAGPTAERVRSRSKMRILVVDDDPLMRSILTRFLESRGYVVETAGNGRQALETLGAGPAHAAVLLDLNMPVLGGIDTLASIKRTMPELPVIVLTAAETKDLVDQAKALGAFDYILKPPDLRRVEMLLLSVCG